MGSSRASRALAVLALAAASGSCQEQVGTDFSIRFVLDSEPGSFCAETACEAYPMWCGARLSVRVFDLEEGNATRGSLVSETCEVVPSSAQLCDLEFTSDPKTVYVPLHNVRIEVAAWHPADAQGITCPGVTFNLSGRPDVGFRPRPAVAGSKTFDVRSSKVEVLVPLQCTDITRLDDEQCQAEPSTLLKARVDDLALGYTVSRAQAEELSVSAAPTTPVDGSATAQRIDVDDLITLSRVTDGAPQTSFEHNYPGRMSGTLCTVVRDSGPEVTSTATCRIVPMGQTTVDLRGILVTREKLQPLLDAMGSEFPETGLVVGRVLSQSGLPLARVRVIPSAGTVEYLDEAGTGFSGTATSADGYFISRDAPFGTTWRATSLTGLTEQSIQVGGLVTDMVSPVILRMVDSSSPPPDDGGDDDDDDDDDGADLGDSVP